MEAKPYGELTPDEICALCVYREARGEPLYVKRGVVHVIYNRVAKPGWWGKDVPSVVLKPWQFSSFNSNDPNNTVWPTSNPPTQSWLDCVNAVDQVNGGDPDTTDGATHYYDVSISWPKAWGQEEDYVNTLNAGRLRFWRLRRPGELT